MYTYVWSGTGIDVVDAKWEITECSISCDRIGLPSRYSTHPKIEYQIRVDFQLGYPLWQHFGVTTQWCYSAPLHWEAYSYDGLIKQPVSRIVTNLIAEQYPDICVEIPDWLKNHWV